MSVLAGLEPERVFYYFEEITKIPHGSGNVDRISDYLVRFAKERGLEVIQDRWKNVIIIKEATPGYEKEPTVILQGHMDMVAVKKPGLSIDMRTEGLHVAVQDDFVYAEGTSLGGDDGIAVAYALALLDGEEYSHPRLEVVITVDEETGMDGAREIDLSMLQGNRLLNLDSEEEGIFLTSCAGGARVACKLPVERENVEGNIYHILAGGLLGGHSGEEIIKGRGNSNILFGRILHELGKIAPVQLISVQGGLADNAIPRETAGEIYIPEAFCEPCEARLKSLGQDILAELGTRDPGFTLQYQKEKKKAVALTVSVTERVGAMLVSFPNGVQTMSADVPGLVETSLNLGILTLEEKQLQAEFSVRSSVESAKEVLIGKLFAITGMAGGTNEVTGEYPGWKFRTHSPLREKMVAVYEEMYGVKPQIQAIHAGLECGLLGSKIEDLDCVSIGPDMQNIHTTEEKLSISSTRRVWEFLIKLLETKEKR